MNSISLTRVKNYINKNKLEEINEKAFTKDEAKFYNILNAFVLGNEIKIKDLLNEDIDFLINKISELLESNLDESNQYSLASELLLVLKDCESDYKINTKLLF